MRDIRFKGKSLLTGEWIQGRNILRQTNGSVFIINSGEMTLSATCGYSKNLHKIGAYIEFAYIEVDPETVCQYTETVDSTTSDEFPWGQEIWEKDVVECANEVGVIYYDNTDAAFMVRTRKSEFEWSCRLISEYIDDIRVIGNEVDNPGLMKEKE